MASVSMSGTIPRIRQAQAGLILPSRSSFHAGFSQDACIHYQRRLGQCGDGQSSLGGSYSVCRSCHGV